MGNRLWKTFGFFAGIVLIILFSFNASSAGTLTPQRGGILKISNPGEPPIFNPMMNPSMRVIGWTAEVFNGLVMVDPTQEEVSVEKVVPSLAEKWEISLIKRFTPFI
jgi:ABC-type transport system substrate-binding protein